MRALRLQASGCLLAALLVCLAIPHLRGVLSDARGSLHSWMLPGANGSTVLPMPRPAPERLRPVPAAFSKPVPTSLADLQAMQAHVEDLVAKVSPAVVAVEIDGGTGSGVVISEDGLVLTAGHVCGAPGLPVRFTFPNGKTVPGKTLGLDEDIDTGLMRITVPGHWPHLAMGEAGQARVGDWVLALGNPGGFDPRRSLVVRLGRILRLLPDVIQTDCTISPGDSGGPLVDMQGRVVGIHTAIRSSLTENYHVPIAAFYASWTELTQSASPRQPEQALWAFVGATSQDAPVGCRLSAVDEHGPAAQAGLKPGDVVSRVDGRPIQTAAAFRRWVAEAKPGDVLHLEVQRAGQILEIQVKLGTAPHLN